MSLPSSSGASRPPRTRSRARPRTTGPSGSGLGRLKAAASGAARGAGHRERWRADFGLLPTDRRQRVPLLARVQPHRARARRVRRGRARARARRASRALARLGIEPVVTLHHYTHPRWFWARGRLGEPEERRAVRPVRRGRRRGPRRRASGSWVTLNEPVVFLLGGYLGGQIPPGRAELRGGRAGLRAPAARARGGRGGDLREAIPAARVGIAHNMLEFAPDRRRQPRSTAASRGRARRSTTGALLEAIATGRHATGRSRARGASGSRIAGPRRPRTTSSASTTTAACTSASAACPAPSASSSIAIREGRGLTDTGWEVHPAGFDAVLRQAARAGLPVIVTENGIATRDDRRRARLPARARARPRAPPRRRARRSRATSTGRCSTTSSGSRASGRGSASSRSTTRRSPGGAGGPSGRRSSRELGRRFTAREAGGGDPSAGASRT